jgi:predicted methyltransferase
MAAMTVLAATALVSSGWPQNPSSQHTAEFFNNWDKGREQLQRASDILRAMEVTTGDWVADVGAGGGYYSQRLAELVGPSGRVLAEDIVTMTLLNERMKLFDLRNVEALKGEVDDPKLPNDSLAAVLVVDAYHHFSQYQSMTEHILRALKPGGRFVIADYSRSGDRSQPRADQIKKHEIDPALVRTELERVGFRVLRCEDPFLKQMPEAKGSRAAEADLWLMTAVRPKP